MKAAKRGRSYGEADGAGSASKRAGDSPAQLAEFLRLLSFKKLENRKNVRLRVMAPPRRDVAHRGPAVAQAELVEV